MMHRTSRTGRHRRAVVAVGLLAAAGLAAASCWRPSAGRPEVVVYTALDSEFSKPILDRFTQRTGILALPKFDTESTKTVGLAEAIRAEAARVRCDVFWNNEILNTLRLQREGLLQVCPVRAADDYPAMYRSPEGLWYGFAARARVLIVNIELVPEEQWPDSIFDLADPKWRGRCGMAKPLFGTTATHAACLFACLGEEKAKEFFRVLKENDVQILSGNRQVAISVGAGRLAFGITDTDDAILELEEKASPVAIIYPDQPKPRPKPADAVQPSRSSAAVPDKEQPTTRAHEAKGTHGAEGEPAPPGTGFEPGLEEPLGTLFIPNTLCVIKGAPHPEAARQLVEYLLSPEVEAQLAQGRGAQIPLGRRVKVEPRVETPRTIKPMQVDFEAAADKWDVAARFLRDLFTGP